MLLNTKEAAKYLNVCPEVLMDEHHSGRLVAFKIGGRWRFDSRDLDQYIDDKRQAAAMAASAKVQKGAGKKIINLGKAAGRQQVDRVWLPGKRIGDVCAAATAARGT